MKLPTVFCVIQDEIPYPYSELETLYPYDDFGWFLAGRAAVLKNLIQTHQVETIVELGSFLGKSTRFFASQLPENGIVYAVDHWEGSLEHQNPSRTDVFPKLDTLYERFLSNIIHADLCHKIIPMRTTTIEAADLIDVEPDMIFVDASHQYEDVLLDLETWYPKLKEGGVLCGDDWTWGKTKPVARAVKEFAKRHQLRYKQKNGVWWIHKESI